MITKDDQFILQYLLAGVALKKGRSVELHYIANPDGTIRWVYPSNTKSPHFLNFYSTSSIRSKIFSCVIKLAFFFRQPHFIKSGTLTLQIAETSRLSKILERYDLTGFSIFTGTAGENRKVLIEIHNDKKTFVFVKIAFNESSKELVKNEIVQLDFLSGFNFVSLVVPEILDSCDDGIVEVTNIKPSHSLQRTKLTELHVSGVLELYSQLHTQGKWIELNSLQASKQKISKLLGNFEVINSLEKDRVQGLCQKITLLVKMLEKNNETMALSISHGDFTPWNMYNSKGVLYLFDWELCQREMPMMIDFIHFIFQSEIMIGHTGYKGIHAELKKFLDLACVKSLIYSYDIDFNKHYMFYLIHTISYYLVRYVKQQHLHEQVFWLIDGWEDAVTDLLNKKGVLFH